MARASYVETVCSIDPDGTLKALDGVRVTVTLRDSSTIATIYSSSTLDTVVPLPYVTDKGHVEFWANPGAYDIYFEDTAAPKRIADKKIGWDALPGGLGALPGDRIQANSIKRAHLDSVVQNALHPIGEVIEWWRPNTAQETNPNAANYLPPPPGFVPMEGQTIVAGQHDFTAGLNNDGSITIPDHRNKMSMGADRMKLGGSSSVADDGFANAPAIGGPGGANLSRDLRHTHKVPAAIAVNGGGGNGIALLDASGLSRYTTTSVGNISGTNKHGVGRLAASASAWSNNGMAPALDPFDDANISYDITSSQAGTSTLDTRPAHIGLLKMIKVRYA